MTIDPPTPHPDLPPAVAVFLHELRSRLQAVELHLRRWEAARGDGATEDRQLVQVLRATLGGLEHIALATLAQVRASGPARVDEVVQAVVGALRPAAERSGVVLVIDGEAGDAVAERTDVELVLGNVVANAIQFADAGKSRQWVWVRLRAGSAGGALVEVADNGIGIPTELHERVFERFFRGPWTPQPGSGLGLAIAREAAARNGWRLSLESDFGRGSCFRLELSPSGQA